MDRFFDLYREWLASQHLTHTRERLRDWLLHGYCPGECLAEITLLPSATHSVGLPAHEQNLVRVRCHNRSVKPWQFKPDITAGIHLQAMLLNEMGQTICTTSAAGYFMRPCRRAERLTWPFPCLNSCRGSTPSEPTSSMNSMPAFFRPVPNPSLARSSSSETANTDSGHLHPFGAPGLGGRLEQVGPRLCQRELAVLAACRQRAGRRPGGQQHSLAYAGPRAAL